MKRITYVILFFVMAMANSMVVSAQRKKNTKDLSADSIQLMRKFISLCNDYKTQPMHLSLDYISTTNSPNQNDDAAALHAEFYSLLQGGYLKFGAMEEIISDSIALLISSDIKRMMLYRNSKQMLEKMKKMIGAPLQDSSVKHMLGFFEISENVESANDSELHLISRKKVKNTGFSLEELSLKYNNKTNEPVEIINLKRQLEPLTEQQYKDLNSKTAYAGKIIKADNSYYLVAEQQTVFEYKLIDHNPSMSLPVNISDRIMKTADGKYMPVKGYENYKISEER